MKVGILGGSFDPVHKGHLHMAISAYEEYQLDQVLLIPAAHSPNKDERTMTPAKDRLAMCQLAVQDYEFLIASDFEMRYEDTSYTYLTLQRLKECYPKDSFYFIMGADSLDYFDKWYHPEIIASLCTILAVVREGFDAAQMKKKAKQLQELFSCEIRFVHCKRYDISSSELRKEITIGKYNLNHLPENVIQYIKEHELYRING